MPTHPLAVLASAILLAANAAAFPLEPGLAFTGDDRCDEPTTTVHLSEELELGQAGLFPIHRQIAFASTSTNLGTCGIGGGGPDDWEVTITNLSSQGWAALFFVADPGVTIGNADGTITGGHDAFLIDSTGVNAPLIAESRQIDDRLNPGETWTFLVMDFSDPAGPQFLSRGVGDASIGDALGSTASILGVLPEPDVTALLGTALLITGMRVVRRGAAPGGKRA